MHKKKQKTSLKDSGAHTNDFDVVVLIKKKIFNFQVPEIKTENKLQDAWPNICRQLWEKFNQNYNNSSAKLCLQL